jgi:NADPH-dependent glutamate synthase beta subunit-like oxidoreductase
VAVSAIPAERLEAAAFDAEIESVFADVMGERLFLHGNGLSDYPTLDYLAEEYDAVFLAMGLSESPSLADDRPPGVEDAISFLNRCKRGEVRVPERVAVLGGGNTAIDAATQAVRLGARDVYLAYRRSFAEMPAWPSERDEAMRLGVHFLLLTQPLGYELDEHGYVRGMRIARTILGEPDSSGRRAPVVVPGSESILEVELVLEALGQSIPAETAALLQGVELARGLIQVDGEGRTSRPGVYAGGDITNGGSTVVQAVADGMRAADAIHWDFGP